MIYTLIYQVKLINAAIDNAKAGSRLRGLKHVADPSADVVDVLIACMEWNIATRQSRIPQDELPELAKRGSGISKRLTAFCTRSGRSSCGAIPTIARVNLLRCVFVHGIYMVYPDIYYVYCSI